MADQKKKTEDVKVEQKDEKTSGEMKVAVTDGEIIETAQDKEFRLFHSQKLTISKQSIIDKYKASLNNRNDYIFDRLPIPDTAKYECIIELMRQEQEADAAKAAIIDPV